MCNQRDKNNTSAPSERGVQKQRKKNNNSIEKTILALKYT